MEGKHSIGFTRRTPAYNFRQLLVGAWEGNGTRERKRREVEKAVVDVSSQNARRMQSTGKVAISREPGESLVPPPPLRHLRAGSRKRRNEEVGSRGAERRGEKETSRKAVSHRAERRRGEWRGGG